MRAVHDSRRAEHRSPFGAVPVGGTVVLGIDVYDEEPHGCSVRLWSDTRGERILQMERTEVPGGIRYQASVELDEPELLWYHFVFDHGDGRKSYYGARAGHVGGEGELRLVQLLDARNAACRRGDRHRREVRVGVEPRIVLGVVRQVHRRRGRNPQYIRWIIRSRQDGCARRGCNHR